MLEASTGSSCEGQCIVSARKLVYKLFDVDSLVSAMDSFKSCDSDARWSVKFGSLAMVGVPISSVVMRLL